MELINHGAIVDAVNDIGETPLLIACNTGQTESVKVLLELKADPNIANIDGCTSLHSAVAANSSTKVLQTIINHGAKLNATNTRGRTALLLSCFYGQMDAVKVLLEAGADPCIADEEGFSCLHAAIDGQCSKDTLQALIDHGVHVDTKRKDGTNALLSACRRGQSECVKFLVKSGADVNIDKPNGDTSLHVAVRGHCHKEALQTIIQQGVNVNAINKNSQTALIHACDTAQTESVTQLLKTNADSNISNASGYTSLHAAVLGNCACGTLQEIIAHGANVNAQHIDGKTALWLACSYRQQDSVRILLKATANPNIASTEELTSLHAAVIGGCNKQIIRALIKSGSNVNAVSEEHSTALMMACGKGSVNIINVLLNAGADRDVADVMGAIWIHHAVIGGCSKETLQAIINHGADVNATNKNNVIVLMLACRKKNTDAIDVLLNAGANSSVTDVEGETCIHYAVIGGCSKETLQGN